MSLYVKINMDIGLDNLLSFEPHTICKSCIFYWGEYNPNYPFNERGYRVDNGNKQIEFIDIPIKELNWILTEMKKLHG